MKVVSYIRVSTKEQAEDTKFGIPNQRDIIQSWASMHGHTVRNCYVDDGYSGSTQMRPQLQDLLTDIKHVDIDAVVVPYFDRWARDTFLHLYLEKELKVHGVKLLSATEEGLNNDDPASELQRTMMSAFAQYERQRITARMAGGRRQKAKSGGHATGRTPFGYDKSEDGELIINHKEAQIVALIFQYRQYGLSLRAVADRLNKEGYRTKKDNHWTAKSVSYILKNKKYRGVLEQTIQGEKITTDNKSLKIAV